MDGTLRGAGELLVAARAVRVAFPDVDAMRAVAVGTRPSSGTPPLLVSALGFLWDELILLRAGRSTDLTVLDDEMAGVERLLITAG